MERIAEMPRELYRRGLPTTHVDLETFDLDRDQAAQLERQFEVRLGPDGVREVHEHLAAKAVIVAGMRESLRLLPQNPGRSPHTPAATRSCGWTTSTPPLTRST